MKIIPAYRKQAESADVSAGYLRAVFVAMPPVGVGEGTGVMPGG